MSGSIPTNNIHTQSTQPLYHRELSIQPVFWSTSISSLTFSFTFSLTSQERSSCHICIQHVPLISISSRLPRHTFYPSPPLSSPLPYIVNLTLPSSNEHSPTVYELIIFALKKNITLLLWTLSNVSKNVGIIMCCIIKIYLFWIIRGVNRQKER